MCQTTGCPQGPGLLHKRTLWHTIVHRHWKGIMAQIFRPSLIEDNRMEVTT
jgi:hypothetical protein